MMKAFATILVLAALTALTGCNNAAQSARGFRLPEGDIEKGKAAFAELRCTVCHTVTGVDLPVPQPPVATIVPLGGPVYKVKTYGELVTSIINPSHTVDQKYAKAWAEARAEYEGADENADGDAGEMSPMPQFNDAMTVSQMIDIVTFLDSTYRVLQPDYNYIAP